MDVVHFIGVMQNWSCYFINGVDHPRDIGEKLLPFRELSIVIDEQIDVDNAPSEDWVAQYDTLAELFTNFITQNV